MSFNFLVVLVGAALWTEVACMSFPLGQRPGARGRCPQSYGLVLNDFILKRDNVEAEKKDFEVGAGTAVGPLEVNIVNVKTVDVVVTIELKVRSKIFGSILSRDLDCEPGRRNCERKNMNCNDMNNMFGIQGQGMCDSNSRFRQGRFDSQFQLPESLENISGTVNTLLNALNAGHLEVELHVIPEIFDSDTGERIACLDIVVGVHL